MNGLSYTINEFLYRNIPVIVTPLPYLDEIGVKDGVNSYIVNFDCSNVDEVAKKITNKLDFNFKKLYDSYDNIWAEGKSHFKEETIMKKVKATRIFDDIVAKVRRKKDEEFIVTDERADDLVNKALVNIIDEIVEPKIETAVKEEPKETAVKKTRKNAKK